MKWIVLAHAGQPLQPHDLWSAWRVGPEIIVPLLVCSLMYALGARQIWRRAGRGHGLTYRHILSFTTASAGLVLAFLSPLDALSDALFSVHMIQHLLLVLLVAPLWVLGALPLAFLWSLPAATAQRLGHGFNRVRLWMRPWKALTQPISAWILFTLTLWIWHIPVFYTAALENEALHWFEHLSFLLTALRFWWVLFQKPAHKHVHYGMAVLYLFMTLLQSGVLGALMTFTTEPWYAPYATRTPAWGLTPLQDQQLAGLIMWIPGGAVFTLLAIGYFSAWLRALEERSQRRKQTESI